MPTEAMKAVILSRKQQTARRWLLEGSQPSAGDAQATSGRLLDTLTADIETKIQRELAANPQTKRDVAEKLDAYVEANLRQTHACQVCFEVMAPPERTPTMLVPCGHSFCKLCVDTHRGRDAVAASRCPLCRAEIASAAENRALRAIVEDLVGKRRGLEAGVRAATGVAAGEEVFMMHPKFGAVTCCPSNIGTGLRGSVHILVPKLIATIGFEAIDKLCRERNCQARGSSGEHSAVVDRIDISNWRRIGYPEYELVEDMLKCANFLAEEEDKLPDSA